MSNPGDKQARPADGPTPPGLRAMRLWSGSDEYALISYDLPRAGHRGALAALSGAEQVVVVLAARGCSNAEIGRLRSTSVRTVANQVTAAYRKLGVRSRREAAARLAQ